MAGVDEWFLSAAERGNPATELDARHGGQRAWSTGNLVRPLIHGASYFAELSAAIRRMRAGDLLLFADWRGDPDERLTGEPGSEVARLLCDAAERDVEVRGLIWRSHLDRLHFSAEENRHLGEDIEAAGGVCLLDMRVRTGGSHHQKFVVLRHPGRPELDIAFVGGIDLCHSRRDDEQHRGDPQVVQMPKVYGERPPWHDVQLAITGPAVADVETVFRERWADPQPLTRNPVHRVADLIRHDDRSRPDLPPPLPAPEPTGSHSVQLLRTYPYRRTGYAFAPRGERSVARGYAKALRRVERLIYLEDQYLWSKEIAAHFADALRERPALHLIAVLPHYSEQDGVAKKPSLHAREEALQVLREAAPDRVAVYGLENHAGTPVYVHAKVCVLDDAWATVGSDNVNRRSWTHDSELAAAIWDERPSAPIAPIAPESFAAALRTTLAREHLDLAPGDATDLSDPATLFAKFCESADALQRWHDAGQAGPRPAGRLRPLASCPLPRRTRLWAVPFSRVVSDPDGRPGALRRSGRF